MTSSTDWLLISNKSQTITIAAQAKNSLSIQSSIGFSQDVNVKSISLRINSSQAPSEVSCNISGNSYLLKPIDNVYKSGELDLKNLDNNLTFVITWANSDKNSSSVTFISAELSLDYETLGEILSISGNTEEFVNFKKCLESSCKILSEIDIAVEKIPKHFVKVRNLDFGKIYSKASKRALINLRASSQSESGELHFSKRFRSALLRILSWVSARTAIGKFARNVRARLALINIQRIFSGRLGKSLSRIHARSSSGVSNKSKRNQSGEVLGHSITYLSQSSSNRLQKAVIRSNAEIVFSGKRGYAKKLEISGSPKVFQNHKILFTKSALEVSGSFVEVKTGKAAKSSVLSESNYMLSFSSTTERLKSLFEISEDITEVGRRFAIIGKANPTYIGSASNVIYYTGKISKPETVKTVSAVNLEYNIERFQQKNLLTYLQKSLVSDYLPDKLQPFLELMASLGSDFRARVKSFNRLRDPAETGEETLRLLYDEIARKTPIGDFSGIGHRNFIPEARYWNSGKGSENLYKFISRLTNSRVWADYPSDYMFRSSSNSALSGSHKIRDGINWAYFTYKLILDQAQNIENVEEILKLTSSIHPAGSKKFPDLRYIWREPSYLSNLSLVSNDELEKHILSRSYTSLDSRFRIGELDSVLSSSSGKRISQLWQIAVVWLVTTLQSFRSFSKATISVDKKSEENIPWSRWIIDKGEYEQVIDTSIIDNLNISATQFNALKCVPYNLIKNKKFYSVSNYTEEFLADLLLAKATEYDKYIRKTISYETKISSAGSPSDYRCVDHFEIFSISTNNPATCFKTNLTIEDFNLTSQASRKASGDLVLGVLDIMRIEEEKPQYPIVPGTNGSVGYGFKTDVSKLSYSEGIVFERLFSSTSNEKPRILSESMDLLFFSYETMSRIKNKLSGPATIFNIQEEVRA